MAAIFGGAGLGLFNGSLNQLNGFGSSGRAQIGQGSDRAYVNVVNGNLVIQGRDEYVAAQGLDLAMLRTYNSQGSTNSSSGLADGDNNDRWQMSVRRWLIIPPGAATSHADIQRSTGDGFIQKFVYDSSKGLWISDDGDGAHDTLSYNTTSTNWTHTPGGESRTETYDTNGVLVGEADADGTAVTYQYMTDGTGRLWKVTDGSGQITELKYEGTTSRITEIQYGELKPDATGMSDVRTLVRVRYVYTSNRLSDVVVDLLSPYDTTADSSPNTYTTHYDYDSGGRVTRIKQYNSASTDTALMSDVEISYVAIGDVNGSQAPEYRVSRIRDWTGSSGVPANARDTTFTYYLANRRTDATDASGQTTSYIYDSSNRLISVTLPEVNGALATTTYTYDAEDNVISVVDGDGNWRKFSYVNGNQTWAWDKAGNARLREYTSDTNLLRRETVFTGILDTNSLGGATIGTWTPPASGTGQLAGGQVTRYLYDAEQHLSFVVTQEGRVSRNLYTASGNRSSTIDYLDLYTNSSRFTMTDADLYSDLNNVWAQAVGRKRGSRIDYVYDATGQVRSVSRFTSLNSDGTGDTSKQETTYFIYDGAGELLQTIDALGTGPVTSGYLSTAMVTAGLAGVTTYTYDGLMRLKSTRTPNSSGGVNRTTTVGWSATANTASGGIEMTVTAPDNVVTTTVYNRTGEVVSVAKSKAATALGTTSFVYDAAGRLRMSVGPNNERRFFIYDYRGWKVGEVDAEGQLTEYVYTLAGLLTKQVRYDQRLKLSAVYDSVAGKPLNVTIESLRGAAAAGSPTAPTLDLDANDSGGTGTGFNVTAARGVATAIADTDLAAADSSDSGTKLTGATAYIATRYDGNSETLSIAATSLSTDANGDKWFVNAGVTTAIKVTQVNPRGLIRLAGEDTMANYKAALKAIRYTNSATSGTSNGAAYIRDVHVVTEDGVDGNYLSTIAICKVTLAAGARVGLGRTDTSQGVAYDESDLEEPASELPRYDDDPFDAVAVAAGLEQTRFIVESFISDLTAWRTEEPGISTTQQRTARLVQILSEIRVLVYGLDGALEDFRDALAADESLQLSPEDMDAILSSLDDVDSGAEVVDGSVATGPTLPSDAALAALTVRLAALQQAAAAARDATLVAAQPVVPGDEGEEDSEATQRQTVPTGQQTQFDGVNVGSPNNNRTSYRVYDQAGRLRFELDETSALTEYVYDGRGLMTQKIAYFLPISSGAVTYGALKQEAQQQTAKKDNRITRYFYDGDGLLTGTLVVSEKDGADPTWRNSKGFLTRNDYDASGRLKQTTAYAAAATIAVGADESSISSWTVDSNNADNRVTSNIYDAKDQLVGQVDAMGFLTTWSYDKLGNRTGQARFDKVVSWTENQPLSTYMTALGTNVGVHATFWEYDELNRVRREIVQQGVTSSGGAVTLDTTGVARGTLITSYTYGAATGFLDSVTRAAGQVDAQGLTEQVTTSYTYDELGRVFTQTDPETTTVKIKNFYDAAGRLVQTKDGLGHYTLYFYDAESRLRFTVREGALVSGVRQGEVTETRYNAFGEAETSIGYGARVAMDTYLVADSATPAIIRSGIVTDVVNANFVTAIAGLAANADNRVTSTTYTARGEVDLFKDASDLTTDRDYDVFGSLVQAKTDLSATRARTDAWTYDLRGLLTQRIEDKLGGSSIKRTWSAGYDAFGNIISETNAFTSTTSATTTSTYDRLGRLSTVTKPLEAGGIASRALTYDAFSRTLTDKDGTLVSTTYSYDDVGRTITVTLGSGAGAIVTKTTYSRFDQSMVVEVSNTAGTETTKYKYNKNGQLKEIIKPFETEAGTHETRSFDVLGNLTSSTDSNGVITTLTYDAANRVATRTLDPSGLALLTTYEYDAFGGAFRVTDARGTITETTFDEKGRVGTVIVDKAGLRLATVFEYDGLGLIKKYEGLVAPAGGTFTQAQKDAALQITEYFYTKLGQLQTQTQHPGGGVADIVTSYTYDKAGHLVRKTDGNLQDWRYIYDLDGQQVFAADPTGSVTETIFDRAGRVVGTILYAKPIAVKDGQSNLINTDGETVTAFRSRVTPGSSTAPDRITQCAYNSQGQKTFEIDPALAVVRFVYDKAGRVIETVAYANRIATPADPTVPYTEAEVIKELGKVYGAGTNAATTTLADAAATTRHSLVTYDAAGRARFALKAVDYSDGTTKYVVEETDYDANGNVVRKTSYANTYSGPVTTVDLDADSIASGPTTLGGGDKRVTVFVYDAANRLRFTIDPMGAVTESRYDAVGNVIQSAKYAALVPPGFGADRILSVGDVEGALFRSGTSVLRYDFAQPSALDASEDDPNNQITRVGSKLQLKASWEPAGQGAPVVETYPTMLGPKVDLASGPVTFYAEIDSGASAAGRYIGLGVDGNSGSDWRRHGLFLFGSEARVVYVNPSNNQLSSVTLSGAVINNTTYVLEIETRQDQSVLYFYVKGQPRPSTPSHTYTATWTQAGWEGNTVRHIDPAQATLLTNTTSVDKLSLSRTLPNATEADPNGQLTVRDGKLQVTARWEPASDGTTSQTYPYMLGPKSDLSTGSLSLYAEIESGASASGRYLSLGLDGSSGAVKRSLTIFLFGSQAKVAYADPATGQLQNITLPITVTNNTTYVVEIEARQDRSVLYFYAKGQARTPAPTYVYSTTWTQAGLIASSTRYIAPGQALVVNTTSVDNLSLSRGPIYRDDFSIDATGANLGPGLTKTDPDNKITILGGKLSLATTSVPNSYPVVRGPSATLDSGPLALRVEVDSSSGASRFLGVGLESSQGPSRRMAIAVFGSQLQVQYYDPALGSGVIGEILGNVVDNTTYVLEVQVEKTYAVLYFYEKGQTRSVFSKRINLDWTAARFFANTGPGASATMTLDNLSFGLASSEVDRNKFDAAGRLISSTDASNNVESYGYDVTGVGSWADHRTTLTNKKSDVWTYIYDGVGRLKEERSQAVDVTTVGDPTPGTSVNIGIPADLTGISGGAFVTSGSTLTVKSYVLGATSLSAYGNRTYAPDAKGRTFHAEITTGTSSANRSLNFGAVNADASTAGQTTLNVVSFVGGNIYATSKGTDGDVSELLMAAEDNATYVVEVVLTSAGNLFSVWKKATSATPEALALAASLGRQIQIAKNTAITSRMLIGTVAWDAAHAQEAMQVTALQESDGAGASTVTTTPASIVTQYSYDGFGNVSSRVEAAGSAQARSTRYAYDAAGRQITTYSAAVGIYNATLDQQRGYVGRNESLAVEQTSNVYYDAQGNAVISVDQGGQYSYKAYDEKGRIRFEIDALKYVTEYTYDAFDDQVTLKRYANPIDAGALVGRDPLKAFTVSEMVTLSGQVASTADDRLIQSEFDVLGRKWRVTQPAAFSFDSTQTGAAASLDNVSPVTVLTFDAYGAVVRESRLASPNATAPVWEDTHYYYDARGDKRAEIDPERYLTTWDRDAYGNITRELQYADRVTAATISDTSFVAPALAAPQYSMPDAPSAPPVATWTSNFANLSQFGAVTSLPGSPTYFTAENSKLVVRTQNNGSGNTSWIGLGATQSHNQTDRVNFQFEFKVDASQQRMFSIGVGNPDVNMGASGKYGHFLQIYGDTAYFMAPGSSAPCTLASSHLDSAKTYVVEIQTDSARSTIYLYEKGAARTSGTQQQVGTGAWTNLRAQVFSYGSSGVSSPSVLTINSITEWPGTTTPDVPVQSLASRQPRNVREIKYEYDALGRKVREIQVGVDVANVTSSGDSISVNVGDIVTETGYDVLGNVTRANDVRTRMFAVSGSQVVWSEQSAGSALETAYDALGRALTVLGPQRETAFGSGVSVRSLISYKYDALGNQVMETRHGGGIGTATLPALPPAHADDQITLSRYNALGQEVARRDSMGTWHYSSYDAYGHKVKEWQSVATVDRPLGNKTTLYRFDAVGQQISAIEIMEGGLQSTDEAQYDGFGQIKAKGHENNFQEYYKYDRLGRVWKTNEEDGVNKVYLYDLAGNVTAQIVSDSRDLSSATYSTAKSVYDLTSGTRETITIRDHLGRVVEQDLPGYTQADAAAAEPVFSNSTAYAATGHSDLIWDMDAPEGATTTLKVRRTGGSWQNLTLRVVAKPSQGTGIDPHVYKSYFAADTYGLNEAEYEYELVYTAGASVTKSTGKVQIWGAGTTRVDGTGVTFSVYNDNGRNVLKITGNTAGLQAIELTSADNRLAVVRVPLRSIGGGAYIWDDVATLTGGSYYTKARTVGTATSYVYDLASIPNYGTVAPYTQFGARHVIAALRSTTDYATIPQDATLEILQVRPAGSNAAYIDTPHAGVYFNVSAMISLPRDFDWKVRVLAANGTPISLTGIGGTSDGYLTGTYLGKTGSTTQYTTSITSSAVAAPVTKQSFDRWGNLKSQTDQRTSTTTYDYDGLGRLIHRGQPGVTIVAADGTTSPSPVQPHTYYAYDVLGNNIADVDANGTAKLRRYDVAGNLLTETNGIGGTTRYTYDALGRQVATSDALMHATTRTFDQADRLIAELQPASTTPRKYRYDALGRRINDDGKVSVYSSRGDLLVQRSAAAIRVQYVYDFRGNKVREIDGNNNDKTWTYNAFGRLEAQKDLGGNVTAFGYNSANDKLWETISSPTVTNVTERRYSYYENGWVKSISDASAAFGASLSEYWYDKAGAVTRERYRTPKTGVQWPITWYDSTVLQDATTTYDALGRVTRVVDINSSTEVGYDAVGNRRMTRATYHELDAARTLRTMEYWYQYDRTDHVMASLHALVNSSGTISKADGYSFAYDIAGNRAIATNYVSKDDVALNGRTVAATLFSDIAVSTNIDNSSGQQQAVYHYDDANRLTDVMVGTTMTSHRAYNDRGLVTTYTAKNKDNGYDTSTYTYYDDDRMKTQVTDDYTSTYSYDAAGNLFTNVLQADDSRTTWTYFYLLGSSYKQLRIESVTHAHGDDSPTYRTYYNYDYRENQIMVQEDGSNSDDHVLFYNSKGQLLQKTSGINGGTMYSTLFVNAGDRTLGSYGDQEPSSGSTPVRFADFDYNVTPVSDQYPATAPGSYVVQNGDTLQSVALQVFGDSALWYLIADANGLSSSDALEAGQALRIPNAVTNSRNAADTFRPFDAQTVLGDTTPPAPPPPLPPNHQKCGLAQVIIIAVAIVVSFYAGPDIIAGATSMLEGSVAAGAVVGAAATAAVSSVASQGAAIVLGEQKRIDWGQVGSSALAAGVTAGVTQMAAAGWLGDTVGDSQALQGAIGDAATQGLNLALHKQQGFSWGSVAASGVIAGISGKAAEANPNAAKPVNGVVARKFTWSNFAESTVKEFAKSFGRQLIIGAIDGHGTINMAQVAADTFGNAIGNAYIENVEFNRLDVRVQRASATDPYAVNDYLALRQQGWSNDQAAEAVRSDLGDYQGTDGNYHLRERDAQTTPQDLLKGVGWAPDTELKGPQLLPVGMKPMQGIQERMGFFAKAAAFFGLADRADEIYDSYILPTGDKYDALKDQFLDERTHQLKDPSQRVEFFAAARALGADIGISVNGLQNSFLQAYSNGMAISQENHDVHKDLLVMNIYNAEHTMNRDVAESSLTMVFHVETADVIATELAINDAYTANTQATRGRSSSGYTQVWGHSEGSIITNRAVAKLLPDIRANVDLYNLGTATGSLPSGMHSYSGVGNVNDMVYALSGKIVGLGGPMNTPAYREGSRNGNYNFTESHFVVDRPGQWNHSLQYYFSDPSSRVGFGFNREPSAEARKIYETSLWLAGQ